MVINRVKAFIEIYIKLALLKAYFINEEEIAAEQDKLNELREALIIFVLIGARAGKNGVCAEERAQKVENFQNLDELIKAVISGVIAGIMAGISQALARDQSKYETGQESFGGNTDSNGKSASPSGAEQDAADGTYKADAGNASENTQTNVKNPENQPGMAPNNASPSGKYNEDYKDVKAAIYDWHEGVDYGGKNNIYSKIYGKVVWAPEKSYPGYGRYMIIQDSNNPKVFYLGAHFESRNVKVGDVVQPGTLLGISGRSGLNVNYDHLHTGVYIVSSGQLKSKDGILGLLTPKFFIRQEYSVDPFNWGTSWKGK